ncbi:MAG: hypothetical protein R3E32_26975 [Chitinophagales bacterium]
MNNDNQNIDPNTTNSQSASKDFHFTAITWKDVTDKVNFQAVGELLNEKLTLSNYGGAVKSVYCTFLAIQANNEFHDEFVDFDTEEQILEMALKVDIRQLKDATEADTLQLMAKVFLEYIVQYPSIEGFDQKRFYADVQSVFAEKGWLQNQNTAVVLTLSEKAQITGLEEAIVSLIETDIDKAALGWIKTYCQKLKVEYSDVMPELFN